MGVLCICAFRMDVFGGRFFCSWVVWWQVVVWNCVLEFPNPLWAVVVLGVAVFLYVLLLVRRAYSCVFLMQAFSRDPHAAVLGVCRVVCQLSEL